MTEAKRLVEIGQHQRDLAAVQIAFFVRIIGSEPLPELLTEQYARLVGSVTDQTTGLDMLSEGQGRLAWQAEVVLPDGRVLRLTVARELFADLDAARCNPNSATQTQQVTA